MISARIVWFAAVLTGTCFAGTVQFPGGTLTVPGISSTGGSFVYTGTLTQASTIDFTQTGNPCLQYGLTQYCTNGAGVITIAGTSAVGQSSGFSGTIGGTSGSWTYGALLMSISGVGTVAVFPTSASNGLGSGSPPSSLVLPTTTLSALGFPNFSVVNPTITFVLADTGYTDNTSQFVLTQSTQPPAIPVPGTLLLFVTALVALAGIYRWRTRLAAH